MKLSLGFSPCPNDTFIFDALIHQKIDTGGLEFETALEDVETLNQWAIEGKLDITKLSFPAFFRSADEYVLMDSGSAMGKGVGPLLVAKSPIENRKPEIENSTVALPGENTTANLLFTFAYPEAKDKMFMVFSEIEDAVLTGKADFGVIIHENRFTYQEKGLQKVLDLGEYWEKQMNMPVPLGGIAINQGIKRPLALQLEILIRKSIAFAFENYPVLPGYVKQHAQAMSEEVMRKHIDLYVNDLSLSLGKEGKQAIEKLYELFSTTHEASSARLSSQLFLS
jgi:1,4-dihydroxy-6-naphthoate synthase